MARGKQKAEGKKKRHFFRWLLIAGGLAYLAYYLSERQQPDQGVPAGGPEERVLVKDAENLSGLGAIMQSLITEMLKNPDKVALLNTLNLVLAIEPVEQPETAITVTFSDGYVVLEPGVVASPDVKLVVDTETLMQLPGVGTGLAAVKFLQSPEGMKMVQKFMSGQCRVEGAVAHPVAMLKFAKFLSPA